MLINSSLKDKLDFVLNEATILDLQIDKHNQTVSIWVDVITANNDGSIPDDTRLLFIFQPIGRIAASYYLGNWNDVNKEIKSFDAEEFSEIIRSLQDAIYGRDFINCGIQEFDYWKDRISFDYVVNDTIGFTNTIDLFQDYFGHQLNFRIWFDNLTILYPNQEKTDIETLLENAKRGWDITFSNPKNSFGIIPLTEENKDQIKEVIDNFITNDNIK